MFVLSNQAKTDNNATFGWSFLLRGLTRLTEELKAQAYESTTHDIGFKIFLSYGYAYKLTGNEEYKQVVLDGANSLLRRYNYDIGAIKSWDPWNYKEPIRLFKYPVTVETVMNLEILLWAAANGGDAVMRDVALSHAETTLKYFFRPDGCVWHVVDFDIGTNQPFLFTSIPQGYSESSTWARGQAWTILGFANLFKYTQDQRFADAAESVAQCYLRRLKECCNTTYVPTFDFDYPGFRPDSSAAAIAAAGLVRLTMATGKVEYWESAKKIIAGLSQQKYLTRDQDFDFVLLHGMGDYGKTNEDVALIYGDHYFLQAVMELYGQEPL